MTDEDPALTLPWSQIQTLMPQTDGVVDAKWKPSAHTAAVKSVMDALRRLPGWTRVRKRHVGRFIVTDGAGNPRKAGGKWLYVSVAIKGDPDIELLWRWPGAKRAIPVMIEIKTGSGRLSDVQKEKERDLAGGNVIFIVAADAAHAFTACLEAKAYVERHG